MKKSTVEQQQIVESRSPFLRVNAFAGTGKTTTLVSYALARPNERLLYIAFNKSIQLEAKRKFPENVKCVTSHGMAFAKFGARYHEAGKLVESIRVNQVVEALSLGHYPENFALYVGDASLKLLNRFLCSDATEIELSMADGLVMPDTGVDAEDIVYCAKRLWEKMVDSADRSVGMVHDGYLKLYQLTNPKLYYDKILFDEAQDANGVTSAIVEAQNCAKVVVGDSHQSIYSFRGAVNALRRFKAQETLYLTKSFRFGQPIADVANLLLQSYKNERRNIVGTDEPARIGAIAPGAPKAVIARANATLFDEAVRQLAQGRKIHFVGGIQGYRIGDILDTYNLWAGNTSSIQSPLLRTFKSFDTADDYASLSDDKELKSLISVVKRHSSKVPALVSKIKSGSVDKPELADVQLSTAHRSKGLEFDNVELCNDFMDLLDKYKKPRVIERHEEEEVNILYVATTRAQKVLQPYAELRDLIASNEAQKRTAAKASRMPEWARPVATRR